MRQATEAVGNRRLLKLAAFLRTVPQRRFDYNTFIGDDWKGAQNLSCGTTACAFGWAATMPAFRRLGLYLDGMGDPKLKAHPDEGPFEAAERLFGIDYTDSWYLFAPIAGEERATPKYVARKIERFVKARTA